MESMTDTPYRVYTVETTRGKGLGEPNFLGACDDLSLALLLHDLRKSGRIGDRARVGIMFRPFDGVAGEWLVNPWA